MPDQEPSLAVVMAFAHAVDPALRMLDVVAYQPIQGEAMHKVIGYYAAKALRQVGWMSLAGSLHGACNQGATEAHRHCKPVYTVSDCGPT